MIYELTYLIHPEADYQKKTNAIKELLEKLGFKLIEPLHNPFSSTLRRLGYPINHQFSGYYQTFRFDNNGNPIIGLGKEIKFDKEILRSVVVKLPMEALEAKKPVERPAIAVKKEKETTETTIKQKDKNKVKIEELDKKLDEILDNNIL